MQLQPPPGQTILFGASGTQGQAIAAHLLQQGYQLIGPVRSTQSAELVQRLGVHPVITDFSVSSLVRVMAEARQAIIQVPVIITPGEMERFATQVLTATAEAGVPHTVMIISSIIPTQQVGLAGPDMRLILAQLAHEIIPNAVILSTTLYLENFSLAYRQAIQEQGIIPQAIPVDVPVSYLAMTDLARYVDAAVRRRNLKGQLIRIGGREALTGTQLAHRLGAVLNKPLQYIALQPVELVGFLTPLIGPSTAEQVGEMYAWEGSSGAHLLAVDPEQSQEVMEVTPVQFEAWAKEAFADTIKQRDQDRALRRGDD